ncbi:MAG TPA: serine hydroxymethyltransferase [Candidatus Methanofastidiosa archaeon]|nr:serine hydroxymethyltransferase [Candidatus Methanofastidiosa archaeon]
MVIDELSNIRKNILSHEEWRSRSLNMIASENITSKAVERAVASGLSHKYAEGWPKARFYQGCKYFDEVELASNSLFYKLFDAEYVDLRPISGTNANMAMFFGLAEDNDLLMALHTSQGGHISHTTFGSAGMRCLRVATFPFINEDMCIDVDQMVRDIREKRPKIVLFGASLYLFPHPVKDAVDAANEVGATIAYDGAHVLGLIAGKQFQDPLGEGAKVLSGSTHKTFFGPQGGLIVTRGLENERLAKLQWGIFPGVLSNHHLHHVAAKGIAAAEMLEFGKDYARQVVKNAQALAGAMAAEGFNVLCEHKGYTQSHQVVADVSKDGGGKWVAESLEGANIIINKNLLPWDPIEDSENPSGIRIGVSELTRVGMRESEMQDVARFFKMVVKDKKDPKRVGDEVSSFRNDYQKVLFGYEWDEID